MILPAHHSHRDDFCQLSTARRGQVKFDTACFHPNVDTAGNICLNPGIGAGNSGTGNGDPDYDLGQSASTNIFIQGLTPTPATDAQTETYLATLNTGTMDAVGGTFLAAASPCATPPTS